MSDAEPELHLFVVWEHGRPWAERVLRDVARHFAVLDVREVGWDPAGFARSLSRFYGQSLPPGSDKVEHVGTGPFLLVVVRDDAPSYGQRRKWGAPTRVNTRTFDAKERYRSWTGGHRVHNTTGDWETDHDLYLLLGQRAADVLRTAGPWDGRVRRLDRELTGTGGWESREALLTAVELTLPYVALPDDGSGRLRLLVEGSWPHWGVEWLVSEPDRRDPAADPAHHEVVVGGQRRVLELRAVGDGSADARWQRALLARRVRAPDGTFVPDDADARLLRTHERLAAGLAVPPDDAAALALRLAALPALPGQRRSAVQRLRTTLGRARR